MESVYVKLYESKTRLKHMRRMRKEGVGFGKIENFLQQINGQKKTSNIQGYKEEKICVDLMNIKVRDERRLLKLLKTRKEEVDGRLIQLYGRGTRKQQRQRKHLGWVGNNARRVLDAKYDRKISHLREKYDTEGRKKEKKKLRTRWKERHPGLEIYKELDGEIETPTPNEDEITQVGDFSLNKNEREFLKYPPKTTLERPFDINIFKEDSQQMGCKLRWEEERANNYNKEREESLIPDEIGRKYEDLDDDEKLDLILQESKDRQIYNK